MNPLQILSRYRILQCTAPGCDQTVEVDRKHVPNLTARGGWFCHTHRRGV